MIPTLFVFITSFTLEVAGLPIDEVYNPQEDNFVVPPFPMPMSNLSTLNFASSISDNRQFSCNGKEVSIKDAQDLVVRAPEGEIALALARFMENQVDVLEDSDSMLHFFTGILRATKCRVLLQGWGTLVSVANANAATVWGAGGTLGTFASLFHDIYGDPKPSVPFSSGSCDLSLFTVDLYERTYYFKMSAGSRCSGLSSDNLDSIICQIVRNFKRFDVNFVGSRCFRIGDSTTGFDMMFSIGTNRDIVDKIDCNSVDMGRCDWSPANLVQNKECKKMKGEFKIVEN